jgi:hypothetical protein
MDGWLDKIGAPEELVFFVYNEQRPGKPPTNVYLFLAFMQDPTWYGLKRDAPSLAINEALAQEIENLLVPTGLPISRDKYVSIPDPKDEWPDDPACAWIHPCLYLDGSVDPWAKLCGHDTRRLELDSDTLYMSDTSYTSDDSGFSDASGASDALNHESGGEGNQELEQKNIVEGLIRQKD